MLVLDGVVHIVTAPVDVLINVPVPAIKLVIAPCEILPPPVCSSSKITLIAWVAPLLLVIAIGIFVVGLASRLYPNIPGLTKIV